MKFLLDVHSHTVHSSHAYSTLEENIRVAKEKGLEYYGVSDHGPQIPGGAHPYYFHNLRIIPREIYGMKVLRGAEANIIDYNGTLDLQDDMFHYIDYVIASVHPPCLTSGTPEENTNAIIGAMRNPNVKIIGHPDDSRFPLDYERLVIAAKETDSVLEVNNSSLAPTSFRANGVQNVKTYLELCKKHQVPIIAGSDAHISLHVGSFENVIRILKEVDFPEELVMNLNLDKFLEFINFSA